ncbi:MAG: ECF transporter S component [Candidatus Cloacimonetes bacterium]|nr:ECF transporter S component [Candidatus Cloacimonadota bacterium]
MFKRFSTRDLIIIAVLAGIGLAIKPIVSPLSKMISMPLMVPGGSFTGGLYMLWLALAVLIVRKPGTGFIFGLLQALVTLVIGVRGNQGLLTLLSYTLPGILADAIRPLVKDSARLWPHLTLCAVANIAGAMVVAILLFHHPPLFLLIILGMSLVSGLLGGWIGWSIFKSLKHYELIE